MTDPAPWTLERVESEAPELAPLARLHRAVEDSFRHFERTHGSVHPAYTGAPAIHWLEGRPLLDACAVAPIARVLPGLVNAAATAVVSASPAVAPAAQAVLSSTQRAGFPWDACLAHFRDPAALPSVAEPELFHFLLLRAVSVPARHLGRSVAAPHPDRWKRRTCPFCGIAPAASVARTGSGRTHLCVLCGGRWETTETICAGCGEQDLSKMRVLAAREAGPASLESCGTCGASVKVFSAQDLVWGPPLAVEILTVRIDMIADRDEGVRRDAVAIAALFPP